MGRLSFYIHPVIGSWENRRQHMPVDIENAGVVPRDDYQKVLEQIIAEGQCPFCEQHLMRHHREPILWKSSHWIVTRNAWPYVGTSNHFLLIAREHVERIEDMSREAQAAFFDEYARIIDEFSLIGATVLWRSGSSEMTGASVHHLHAQIVVGHPRTSQSEAITALVGFGPI